ncbi:uncharacterized protein EI90DRAFT_3157548 [Cantharellus anzutake]|uniref:uncharacterized protein n=1 Tax=Cantharellus anzutake TaxID=1750568 RepID=UPI00190821D1|nr:uncharacterized protein EI90DRAFT_3157548 [Cantharellus anzutake]KAF8323601.1 hypothetical protein EI90DRAFT_3157548 [Cantharellus anzutake]
MGISTTFRHVLTDGGDDASQKSVKIPENWEEKPLDDPVRTCVQTYLTVSRNGHFPYSLEPHLPTTNPPPVSVPTPSAQVATGGPAQASVLGAKSGNRQVIGKDEERSLHRDTFD